jgi:hypothetical protein
VGFLVRGGKAAGRLIKAPPTALTQPAAAACGPKKVGQIRCHGARIGTSRPVFLWFMGSQACEHVHRRRAAHFWRAACDFAKEAKVEASAAAL